MFYWVIDNIKQVISKWSKDSPDLEIESLRPQSALINGQGKKKKFSSALTKAIYRTIKIHDNNDNSGNFASVVLKAYA